MNRFQSMGNTLYIFNFFLGGLLEGELGAERLPVFAFSSEVIHKPNMARILKATPSVIALVSLCIAWGWMALSALLQSPFGI